jgi:hypothetical protein
MKELQTYTCHKRVQAFKITEISNDPLAMVGPKAELYGDRDDDISVVVDVAFMRRCNPEVGGYYVRYEDGYESYSPAKAFEEGYTRVSSLDEYLEAAQRTRHGVTHE